MSVGIIESRRLANILILDIFISARVAYSVRKLRTAYAGSCLRVRRSSDNNESDIGFVSDEIDTATLLSFVGANNGFVVTWYDQSGNGIDFTQATQANQPQIVSSGSLLTSVSGKVKIVFDGTNDLLTASAVIDNTISNIWCFVLSNGDDFGLIKDVGAATWGWRVQSNTSTNTDRLGIVQPTSAVEAISTPLTTGERLLTAKYKKSNQIVLYINGTSVATNTTTASDLRTATGNLTLGQAAGATALATETQEIIIYQSDKTSERVAMELNIMDYFL